MSPNLSNCSVVRSMNVKYAAKSNDSSHRILRLEFDDKLTVPCLVKKNSKINFGLLKKSANGFEKITYVSARCLASRSS